MQPQREGGDARHRVVEDAILEEPREPLEVARIAWRREHGDSSRNSTPRREAWKTRVVGAPAGKSWPGTAWFRRTAQEIQDPCPTTSQTGI